MNVHARCSQPAAVGEAGREGYGDELLWIRFAYDDGDDAKAYPTPWHGFARRDARPAGRLRGEDAG